MRTVTLGITLSALVGSLAFAQNGGSGTASNGAINSSTNPAKKTLAATTNVADEMTSSGSSNATSECGSAKAPSIAETLASNDQFDTLESLLGKSGLSGSLSGSGSLTVFAPTDAAFETLGAEKLATLSKTENAAKLASILNYHVVPGSTASSQFTSNGVLGTMNGQRLGLGGSNGNFTVNSVTITKTDIQCSNGVIHVIDAVLTPTESNLNQVAETSGNFSTFLKACKAAGLDSMLVKGGDFTVFAPTDEAFAKLPAGMLEMLMQPEYRSQLRAILSYHFVPGNRWLSTELGGQSEMPTVAGLTLNVGTAGGSTTLANGSVVNSDLQATNGVLHGVSSVLMPGSSSRPATANGSSQPLKGTTATGQEKESN